MTAPDIWEDDGSFSNAKAAAIYEKARGWPPEQKAALLNFLKAAKTRSDIRTRYSNAVELAKSVQPDYRVTPALQLIADAIETVLAQPRRNLLVTMPPQEGKLVDMRAPVPTPEGWRKHGELVPGDIVFHPSGRPIRVLAKHPDDVCDRRVHFSDHTYIDVHRFHEWTVFDRSRGEFRTIETADMEAQKLSSGTPGTRGHRYRFQLPFREAVDLPDANLPIDPYTLGVWLGDGTSTKAAITHHTDDEYDLPYERTARCVHVDTGVVTDYYRDGLHAALKSLGVYGNKHIPVNYLRGSITQRRSLLSGLIDTDGCISGTQVSFDNANETLVRDTAELIRSLGYRAHVHRPTPAKLSTSGIRGVQTMWRVTFSPHDAAPARLARKVAKFRPAMRRRVAITRIEKLDTPGTGNCITVDSEDGLYVVGEGWTPTHNSMLCSVWTPIRALQLNPNRRIILATYGSGLAESHSAACRDLILRHGTDVVDPVTGIAVEDKIGLKLNPKSTSVGAWRIANAMGGMVATGLGSAITGRAADLFIIDDPYKNMMEADSATYRRKVDEWMMSVALTRLSPEASIVLIQCMTGDTSVLMATGLERKLKDVRPGDRIATYEDGKITTSTVRKWANQGEDDILRITLKSGRCLRANARHPFLTSEGVWVKTSDLKPGQSLIGIANGMDPARSTPKRHEGLLSTLSVASDEVVEIVPDGREDVFDIQVDRTENFIANGVVSHNTRWHPEDLSGTVLKGEREADPRDRSWRHINIPAIAEEGIPDALGRKPGEVMVSARNRTRTEFEQTRKKVGERVWYALYQGSPVIPAGGLFSRDWFEPRLPEPPEHPVASIVGVDPADSGEGDETGIIGGMLAQDGTVVLAEDWSGQMTADDWSRQAVLLALKMGAREIALEAFATATTYEQVIKRSWWDIHHEAVEKNKAGAKLTAVEQRALSPNMPFVIHKWRASGDAVGRSALLRQALETGKCRVVEFKMAMFENQAADWQQGQHQPDRVAAALITHDRLAALGSGRMSVASPVTAPPSVASPAWLRRRIG